MNTVSYIRKNDFAVAICKNRNIVGHVPQEILESISTSYSGSKITCIISSDR